MSIQLKVVNCVWCGMGHKNVENNTYTMDYTGAKIPAFVCHSCMTLDYRYCKKCNNALWHNIMSRHPHYCVGCLEDKVVTCVICEKEIKDKYNYDEVAVCDIGNDIVFMHSDCLYHKPSDAPVTYAEDEEDEVDVTPGTPYSSYFKENVGFCHRCGVITLGKGKHNVVHTTQYDFIGTPRTTTHNLCTVCYRYTGYDALSDCWVVKDKLLTIDTIYAANRFLSIRTAKANLLLPKEDSENNYLVCSRCGADSSFLFHDSVCLTCKKQGQTKIHQYSYKPLPVFFDVPEDKESHNNLFFGVENEFSFSLNASDVKEGQITSITYSDFWYFKSDSSIANGYECVTHPASLRYWQSCAETQFEELFKKLSLRKHSSCGLHIHMPKAAFTNAHLFKFGFFITKEIDFFSKVAGRKPNSYCNLDGTDTLINKAKDKKGTAGRYTTLNTSNDHTVEVRLFSGKTTFSDMLHDVECLAALYYFTKQAKVSDIHKKGFIQYVLDNNDIYPIFVKDINIK